MLKKILLGIVVVLVALLCGAYLLPRNVHVERAISIQAPPATVFALVNGYKLFNKWSPWFDKDPNAKFGYEGPTFGEGAKITWAGDPETVDTGSQTIVESMPHELVKTQLEFAKGDPAIAAFKLTPEGEGTKVVWSIDADMRMNPIGRYMGLMFDRWVGPDFEKGLVSLKALAESLPKSDFAELKAEVLDVKPVRVAYVETTSSKDGAAIGAAIGGAYAEVGKFLKANGLNQAGAPMTINTKWDDSGYAFDAAIPVDKNPDKEVPADSKVKLKDTYTGPAIKVVHKGPYSQMPKTYEELFAWAAAHGYEQNGVPWDEYVSDPGQTPEPELITYVFLPVK